MPLDTDIRSEKNRLYKDAPQTGPGRRGSFDPAQTVAWDNSARQWPVCGSTFFVEKNKHFS